MICRHEWVFIALVTCQSQSSAHPTRIHLWKTTGEHGLSLFPFLLWSMDLYNIHTQRSHKGLRLQQYCGQSHPNNSYEVRCKSLLIIQKCLKEVLTEDCILPNDTIFITRSFNRLNFRTEGNQRERISNILAPSSWHMQHVYHSLSYNQANTSSYRGAAEMPHMGQLYFLLKAKSTPFKALWSWKGTRLCKRQENKRKICLSIHIFNIY